MEYFIAICGFIGAWFLVAGPLLQAVLELQEQEFDREKFETAASSVAKPAKVSARWWLLPPVAWYRNRKSQRAYQNAILDALPADQRAAAVGFTNKATGWFIVAGGAFLLATKETWELVETFELHVAIFWVLLVVAFVLSVANAAVRMLRTNKVLGIERPKGKRGKGHGSNGAGDETDDEPGDKTGDETGDKSGE
ncbi:MAG: hypothetical protein ABJA94_06605 [Rhodoglobus sp.]